MMLGSFFVPGWIVKVVWWILLLDGRARMSVCLSVQPFVNISLVYTIPKQILVALGLNYTHGVSRECLG